MCNDAWIHNTAIEVVSGTENWLWNFVWNYQNFLVCRYLPISHSWIFLQVGLLIYIQCCSCMLNLWSLPCFDLNSLFMLWYRMLKYSPVVYLSLSCHHCEMFTFSNLKILFILRCSLPVSDSRLVQWIFRLRL